MNEKISLEWSIGIVEALSLPLSWAMESTHPDGFDGENPSPAEFSLSKWKGLLDERTHLSSPKLPADLVRVPPFLPRHRSSGP